MNSIFKIVISIPILYVLNLTTMWISGTDLLIKKAINNTHTTFPTYQWTSQVNVLCNIELDSKHIKHFQTVFQGTIAKPIFSQFDLDDDTSPFDKKEDNYYYFVQLRENNLIPKSTIYEGETIEEYGAAGETDYIWLFFCWIKIQERSLGIS
ncbi:hypothetical protein GXP67_05545 [Rhodocytophaga rosea]|uniref:Uncharacterized protein n=1 Tax=Rhodocytophaga rosea TaxID=2704465 RepID=A0A6C0GDT6_9BACT|nr:hypothetical protein [Rhodocytophaga rosea]QHT66169.1 hypothetical protein GXP67_05545 [Rhodocytophaga rosea]